MSSDTDAKHLCLVAFDVCGCLSGVVVLTSYESAAYKDAAEWTKRGDRVEQMTVAAFRPIPLHCPDHPSGPPWWKSHGGNGKRPAEYQPQTSAGL